jgi:hypothetical protein
MKRPLQVVMGVLLVAALGWATWQAERPLPREAEYEGLVRQWPQPGKAPPEPTRERHPLSFWLTNTNRYFAGKFVQMPTAIPGYSNDILFISLERTNQDSWPAGLLTDSNAVPFLTKALRRDTWLGAAFYRTQVWPKLPPPIQMRLPRPPLGNTRMRMTAVDYLTLMGPMAKPAIPSLISALKRDDNLNVRCSAASALGKIGKGDGSVTTALTKALSDPIPDVCGAAIRALGDTGRGDRAVVAALTEALKDKTTGIRAEATNALLKIDPVAAAKAGIKLRSQ